MFLYVYGFGTLRVLFNSNITVQGRPVGWLTLGILPLSRCRAGNSVYILDSCVFPSLWWLPQTWSISRRWANFINKDSARMCCAVHLALMLRRCARWQPCHHHEWCSTLNAAAATAALRRNESETCAAVTSLFLSLSYLCVCGGVPGEPKNPPYDFCWYYSNAWEFLYEILYDC